jgi:hypothetical protein
MFFTLHSPTKAVFLLILMYTSFLSLKVVLEMGCVIQKI